MRVLIFSCLHIPHKSRPGSDALKATIDWLVWLARSQSVTHVVFLGDAVHNVSRANLPVNLWLRYAVDSFKSLPVQVYWLVGNHDIYTETMHAMQLFKQTEKFVVIQEPTVYSAEGCDLTFLPWMPYMDKPDWWREHNLAGLGRQADFLFCHAPLEKFQKMVAPNDLRTSAPDSDVIATFDAVFAGHYHGPGRDDVEVLDAAIPVIRPGCVLAQDFTDARIQAWFYGAVIWDYDPAYQDLAIRWVANPNTHYFFKGTEAEYQVLPEQVRGLSSRTHFWFTEEPVQQHQGASVVVKPEQKPTDASSKTPYKLDSTPQEDLWFWLSEQSMADTSGQVLFERAKKYLV